jgi:hypothetical protein
VDDALITKIDVAEKQSRYLADPLHSIAGEHVLMPGASMGRFKMLHSRQWRV